MANLIRYNAVGALMHKAEFPTETMMRKNPLTSGAGALMTALAIAIAPLPGIASRADAQVVINGQRVFEPGQARRPQPVDRNDRAKPQNIFEAMFPDLIQQRLQRERALAPPVEVTKISAPKYFTYKADALVRIDLASLAPAETATASPAAAGPDGVIETDGAALMGPPPEEVQPAKAAFDRVAARFGAVNVMAEPAIAKAVEKYYGETGETLWLDADLQPNAQARSILPVLVDAGQWGLEADDYRVDLPTASQSRELQEDDAARFEVELTARVLRYAMDAAGGRVDPNRISGYHDFPEHGVTAAEALKRLTSGGLPARVLASFHPDNTPFKALKAELGRLDQEAGKEDAITFPAGTLIKPGETNAQVPNLVKAIARKGSDALKSEHEAILSGEPGEAYTPELVDLVKAFQKEQGLGVDGVVGPNTLSKLTDVTVADKRQRVILAMERLRWHPRNLGSTRVVINQPAFEARLIRNERTQLATRVIIGKTSNQTSFFHDTIETVEYNPYWGIPRSILVNEYLPKLRENPAYLDERGYEVTDSKGRRLSSASIDWWQVGSDPQFDVRQLPGEANALGELKILFPNKHAIYMHDTPTKPLFSREVRAFSHGCVRLQKPREMAAAVLGTSVDHVVRKLAEGHNSEDVPGKIPVYVGYFTAWPDDDGKVGYFADIYDRDTKLEEALSMTEAVRHQTS